jgi:hypothetical protein
MAKTSIIQCQDCGADYETVRRNTKYCRVCRMFRDLAYLKALTRECISCDQKFAPLHREDILCGNCDPVTSKFHVEGVCGICQVQATLLHKDIAVCKSCATDPGQRTVFIKALAKKRLANQRANGVT